MSAKLSIADMQRIAAGNGGRCLSKEYVNNSSPLKWMCRRGHTWENPYAMVKAGWWCNQCKKEDIKEQHYQRLKDFVEKKGWRCISGRFVKWEAKLQLQCANGHRLALKPMSILHGNGCRKCIIEEQKQQEFDRLKKIAREKGGRCLSKTYKSYQGILIWQCAKGHKWAVQARTITDGHWCRRCLREEKCKEELKAFKKIALDRGGKCLSNTYIDEKRKLVFQCKEGHIWKSTPAAIKKGHWCYTCNTRAVYQRLRKYSVKGLQQYAATRGGKMLSPAYRNYGSPLLWECSEGHQWKASVYSVVGKGSWCRKCFSKTTRLDFEQIKRSARKRAGNLISPKYEDANTPLQWKCKQGHEFKALARDVRKGKWCPYCPEETKLKKIITRRGGKLLSHYQGGKEPLLCECEKGHKWKVKPQGIKSGTWCPTCRKDRLQLETMMRARNKAGQFVPFGQ